MLYIRTESDTGYNFFLGGNIPAVVSLHVIIKRLVSERTLIGNDAGEVPNWGEIFELLVVVGVFVLRVTWRKPWQSSKTCLLERAINELSNVCQHVVACKRVRRYRWSTPLRAP